VATIQHPTDLLSGVFLARLVYFTLPANLLIYGVNDIADYDTDKNNPKKQSYESLLTPDKQKIMRLLIAATNIPFLIWALFQ
jgi:4-hydroxybenzoate polyprenyltransferase